MMQRVQDNKMAFSNLIHAGLIDKFTPAELEILLAKHDSDGSLRYAVIKHMMVDRQSNSRKPSPRIDISALQLLKQKPSEEVKAKDAIEIARLQLNQHDLSAYINSNIRLVRKLWETESEILNDWFEIIVNHPDYFKDSLLPKIENWPLEFVVNLAKANKHFFQHLFPRLRVREDLSGKVMHDLSSMYPDCSFVKSEPMYAYRFLSELSLAKDSSAKEFMEFVAHAKLTRKELVGYFVERPILAMKRYQYDYDRFDYNRYFTWDEWVDISYNNHELAMCIIRHSEAINKSKNFLKLAKIDLAVARALFLRNDLSKLNPETFNPIMQFYNNDWYLRLCGVPDRKADNSTSPHSLSKKYTGEYINHYATVLKKQFKNSFEIYLFLNEVSNHSLAIILWDHLEYRQLLTEWDWTFLAMNNPLLAVSIHAAACKSWNKFNLNCLARLYEKCALDILSEPEAATKFTRADLLELFKMYSSEKIHSIILTNSEMLDKLHAAANYTGEIGFENLARYFLTENYPEQALACLRKGITLHSHRLELYNCVLTMENVSTVDLDNFLNLVNQAIKENIEPSQHPKLIVIQKLLQAKLLALTGDDEYKSEAQRQFEEEKAELIELDKSRLREENYIKDICHGLYHAAANTPVGKIAEINLFSVEEFLRGTPIFTMSSSDDKAIACYHLTNSIIAYVRADNVTASISISTPAINICKENLRLQEYLEKNYPDFYQQLKLQFPIYQSGQSFFGVNDRFVIPALTIDNITNSRSEGNNQIGNNML